MFKKEKKNIWKLKKWIFPKIILPVDMHMSEELF